MSRLFYYFLILNSLMGISAAHAQQTGGLVRVDFYTDVFLANTDKSMFVHIAEPTTKQELLNAYRKIDSGGYKQLIDSLLEYKEKHELNDWLYYQLVRRVAQQISPKELNYASYTFYKWFMMVKSGYDAQLALTPEKIIFYVYNDEDISDIPFFMVEGKKYMCLNYHDYPKTDLNVNPPVPVNIQVPGATHAFSYKVTRMPDFKPEHYEEKKLAFVYNHKEYHFSIKLNSAIDSVFRNYPGVDFESYFNIPFSKETYGALIPLLRKNLKGLNQVKGVDYLMRFTRYAFLYENDQKNFGKEKRMAPEETLFSNYSDCDDRVALFFYLVKEIYNLPMIALLYPTHITMAVEFSKPVGDPIVYKGKKYSLCEPTPEQEDLPIGKMAANLKDTPYDIVYQYVPVYRE